MLMVQLFKWHSYDKGYDVNKVEYIIRHTVRGGLFVTKEGGFGVAGCQPGTDERPSICWPDSVTTNTTLAIVSVGSVSLRRCVEKSESRFLDSVCVFDITSPGGLAHQQCVKWAATLINSIGQRCTPLWYMSQKTHQKILNQTTQYQEIVIRN